MKCPTVTVPSADEALARVPSPELLRKLSTISEVLVQPAWSDKVPKGERALFVFVSGTLVKLLLKVGNPPLKLMVHGRSFDEAFANLEAVLRGDDVPWEQDTTPAEKGTRKRK